MDAREGTAKRWVPVAGVLLLAIGAGVLFAHSRLNPAAIADQLFGRRLSLNPTQVAQIDFVRQQVLRMGIACIAAGVLLLLVGRRVARGFAQGMESSPPAPTGYAWLFWVSFLSLFFEVIFIRWISTEVRVLAFFKNVPLIAAYLGLGIGCLLAGKRRRYELLFLPGLALLLLFIGFGSDTWLRVLSFAGATVGGSQLVIWGHTFSASWRPVAAMIFFGGVAFLFAAQVLLFVPLGQLVGRGFQGLPRIAAYSVNITGALAGIYAYDLMTNLCTGPTTWFVAGAVPLAWLMRDRWKELAVGVALLAVSLLVLSDTLLPRTWSMYNRISLADSYLWRCPDGLGRISPEEPSQVADAAGRKGEWVRIGRRLDVADLYYMDIYDLSDEFVRRYPGLYGDLRLYSYNLPFTLLHPRSVCIVGAGGGNDVAAALRAGVEEVVAVEIDPVIAEMGKEHHPERPYQDGRVTLVVDDARHFFRETSRRFDMVIFGLLDSHSLFSTFSSVRLDNYVYTREAFERARSLLNPGGSLVCSFAVPYPWMLERFDRMLTETFGHAPAIVTTSRSTTLVSGLREDYRALAEAAGARPLPNARDPALAEMPLSTDDWPFMYQEWKTLPAPFLWGLLVMVAVGGLWVWLLLPPGERTGRGHGRFFWLGVSFLLVEVKGISQLALVWGSTWKVSAVVISVLMLLILLANLAVARLRVGRTGVVYAVLLAALVGSYFYRLEWDLGRVVPTLVLLLPLFFAGIVFAVSFRDCERPEAALGWNLLGGMLGGFLEYTSVASGFRFLALVAAATYLMSWLCGRPRHRAVVPAAPM